MVKKSFIFGNGLASFKPLSAYFYRGGGTVPAHNIFLEILFETVSAFATLGLSTGMTAQLSSLGKLLIMITMMVGRIGSLTFILALKKRQETVEYSYPEERIMLG